MSKYKEITSLSDNVEANTYESKGIVRVINKSSISVF